MLNNKGQSLVLFVLIIPIILLVMILVVDIGKLILLRQELDNINYIVLDYGINNNDIAGLDIKIREIINKNKDDIDNVYIDIQEDKIYITLEDTVDATFSFIENLQVFQVKSSYVGYLRDGKTIIERNK